MISIYCNWYDTAKPPRLHKHLLKFGMTLVSLSTTKSIYYPWLFPSVVILTNAVNIDAINNDECVRFKHNHSAPTLWFCTISVFYLSFLRYDYQRRRIQVNHLARPIKLNVIHSFAYTIAAQPTIYLDHSLWLRTRSTNKTKTRYVSSTRYASGALTIWNSRTA